MLTTAALLAATLLGAAVTTPPPAGSDISVDLTLTSTKVLLPGAYYEVSITNHGPDPLTSATVVVQFGVDAASGWPQPCPADGPRTLTCTFGALPVGETATISSPYPMYMSVYGRPFRFDNTATRTASTPSDPNSANDTDTESCSYLGGGGIPPSPVPTLYC